MAWRSVMIQSPARLSLLRGQLHIENDSGGHDLPIEDLVAIILESPQISLTSALLSACQESGVAIITCDANHLPNGVMLPFQPHSRQLKVIQSQIAVGETLRKRLWQRMIQAKIQNQARCITHFHGKEAAARLNFLAKKVQSGDDNNTEAQAAREYWAQLFTPVLVDKFHRSHYRDDSGGGDDGAVNAALNYGYAVLRACVARALVAYGLLPVLGLHHKNELNAYNLADDIMEVLRPQLDGLVMMMQQQGAFNTELSRESRQQLAGIATALCQIQGKRHTIVTACDRMAAGLVNAFQEKDIAALPLPIWLPPDSRPPDFREDEDG